MKKIVACIVIACIAAVTAACAQDKIVIEGSTTVGPIAKAFAEYYMKKNPGVNITVSESGSGNGAKALINAACDIATMSRAMKKSEITAAEAAGVLTIEHVVAHDGLAIVVHMSNPIHGLKLDQLRNIYKGSIRNWRELGGPDKPIVLVSRDTNSGTYETFESLVMKGEKIAGSAEYVGSNGAVRQRVLSTEGAIGYVGLGFTEGLKVVVINGIEPSAETVRNKSYPLSRPLYMYTNGRPKPGTHLAAFLGLSQHPDGIKMIEDCGFVGVK